MNDRYTYRITWSPADLEYLGLCTEFPSLSCLAPTSQEALAGIRSTVQQCASDMAAEGEPPPVPMAERPYSGTFRVRVPPETHQRLALSAEKQGISLNQLATKILSKNQPR